MEENILCRKRLPVIEYCQLYNWKDQQTLLMALYVRPKDLKHFTSCFGDWETLETQWNEVIHVL